MSSTSNACVGLSELSAKIFGTSPLRHSYNTALEKPSDSANDPYGWPDFTLLYKPYQDADVQMPHLYK